MYTKVLVGLGTSQHGEINTFEVIHLNPPQSKCKALPPYPFEVYGAMAVLGSDGRPIICGGNAIRGRECYTLKTIWESLPSMDTVVYFGQFARLTFPDQSNRLIMTGGFVSETDNDRRINVDSLTDRGWESFSPNLPFALTKHCMVVINSTSLLIIGGHNGQTDISNTYYFHSWRQRWIQLGPYLAESRGLHCCSKIS